MADSTVQSSKAPWHLWIVGVVSLLWNSAGGLDFVMTQTRNATYMKSFTTAQLEFFYGFPVWVVGAWAIGVGGGVFGSVLLLFRRGLAVPFFVASVLGMILTDLYDFVLTDGLKIMGGGAKPLILSGLIFVIGVRLLIYARAQRRRGVLH